MSRNEGLGASLLHAKVIEVDMRDPKTASTVIPKRVQEKLGYSQPGGGG